MRRTSRALVAWTLLAGIALQGLPAAGSTPALPSVNLRLDQPAVITLTESQMERRIYPSEFGLPEPGGLAYSAVDGTIVTVDRTGRELSRFNLFEITAGTARLTDPLTAPELLAFDPVADRLLSLDAAESNWLSLAGPATRRDGADLRSGRRVAPPRLSNPRGLAVDPGSGTVFVLNGSEVTLIDPAGPESGAADDLAGGEASVVSLGDVPARSFAGLAVDPASGNLVVGEADGSALYEVDGGGNLVATYDARALELSGVESMVFAPSGDATDDPANQNLYIADASGAIVEANLTASVQTPVAAAVADVGTVVQTIATSAFNPPSPDPAGITYIATDDRLFMSDSEVNEMSIFEGVNFWELTRTGNVTDTGVSTGFSNEPTGVSVNPNNGHLFVSDDDQNQVTELDPGPDGRYGTSDDIVTELDTLAYGSGDPEGVAYDTLRDELAFTDGVNAEVYRLSPGPNGVFDGIDDVLVGQFDVAGIGMSDPEGIAYDAANDRFVLTEPGDDFIFELTPTGTLIRTIDFSAAGSNPKGSGVVLAPGSLVPTDTNYYIVDRGVDNNSDPNENDGRLYEISAPAAGGNAPPSVSAGPDQSVEISAGAFLDGTITDDGLPDPPATTTALWTQESGPAGANIVSPTAEDTNVTFSQTGNYVFRLTGDDSELSAFDEVSVTVTVDGATTFETRIGAGSDDAEERVSGAVSLTSSDIEMVFDRGGDQTVGLRFNGVTIPQGASIQEAWLQFQVDEANTVATNLTIQAQDADNPPTFTTATGNISTRPVTSAAVSWAPPPWNTPGEQGLDQRTPDIGSVVQEVVNRPLWAPGNSLAIIISGTGERTAESYNGNAPAAAALLHVVYAPGGGGNNPPTANDDSASTILNTPVTVDVAANDTDPDGNLDPTTANTACATCAGPTNGSLVNNGNGTFDYTPTTGFTGTDNFIYEICDTGALCDTATATINVTGQTTTFEVRVAASSDDAEERVSGSVSLGSSDLELVFDSGGDQTVGMRFQGVLVPQGASIINAYVQFQADETHSVATNLAVQGEDADNPVAFSASSGNITSRPRTTAAVNWSPPAWNTVGEQGPAQQTPDLTSVVQEIVNRPGWAAGNAMAIIISGTGERTAESFNGVSSAAPLLHIEYAGAGGPFPPNAVNDTASTPQDTPVTINVTANDTDPDGDLDPTTANTTCPTCSGPANGTLVNNGNGSFDYTPNTGFTGTDNFVYEVCDTGGRCDTANVNITVTAPGSGVTYYTSFDSNTTVPGIGIQVRDEDIVAYNTGTGLWEMYFDASDVGLTSSDLNAFHVRADGSILMSFSSTITVPGLTGGPSGETVEDADVFLFTPTSTGEVTAGSFSFYFDGSDVGLDTASEDIDGLHEFADGTLGVSTRGNIAAGGAMGADEDVHRFTGSYGSNTSGSFSLYFDGSDVSIGSADLNAVSFDNDVDLVFSARRAVTAGADTVDDEDAARFAGTFGETTSGVTSLELDTSALGIDPALDMDGVHISS